MFLLWSALFQATIIPPSWGDDPTDYDHPKTELMDYQILKGEFTLGIGIPTFSPEAGVDLRISNTKNKFHWHGMIDATIPYDAIHDIGWRDLDVIAGGRWNVSSDHYVNSDDSQTADLQHGIGIEVLSFEKAGQYESEDVSGLVRNAIRGIIATYGWERLWQKEYGSDSFSLGGGIGYGSFGFQIPGNNSASTEGVMVHIRADGQIFGTGADVRCSYTNVTSGSSVVQLMDLSLGFDLGAVDLNVGGSVSQMKIREEVDEIVTSIVKGKISIGYSF